MKRLLQAHYFIVNRDVVSEELLGILRTVKVGPGHVLDLPAELFAEFRDGVIAVPVMVQQEMSQVVVPPARVQLGNG